MTEHQISAWHQRRHDPGPEEGCWDCGKDQAVCKRKITYPTRVDAVIARIKSNLDKGYESVIFCYRCRWCDLWHLTSRVPRGMGDRLKKQQRKQLIEQEMIRRGIIPPHVDSIR